ncbi:MAG: aldo/keto reductase [Acidimicrobiia bacterium]|nr:aldo/keto reductase [Acidimicrobiia bacterium]
MRAPTIHAHGADMPAIGYGTMAYPEPERAVELISHALTIGYRHIDTARKYGSEHWVGEAITASDIPRGELWVTTKVTEEDARADDFARSVETSLATLGLDHVDLLLIHWPQPAVPLAETVGALAKAKQDGLTRHIGVSNFNVALMEEAWAVSPEPLLTNQVEYHAYLRQDTLLAACDRLGMILTCHVPLARGRLLDDPVINEIGATHAKTAAQVALRWLVQQPNVAAVPRALEHHEIDEDLDVWDFALSDDEMTRINPLRDRNIRVVDPPQRRPIWDVG